MSRPRRFEFTDGTSSKFWEIGVEGAEVTVRYGRVGTDGQTRVKSHGSSEIATAEVDKLVRQKTKKGYAEISISTASAGRKVAKKTKPTKKTKAPKKGAAPKGRRPQLVPSELHGTVLRLSDFPSVLAFDADAGRLAAHGITSLHLVEMAGPTWSKTIKSREAKALLFHGDDLLVGTKTIALLDGTTGKKRLALKDHKAPANALALAADGETLFTAGGSYIDTHDRFVRAFDLSTGALKWKAKPGRRAGATSVAVVGDVVCVAAEDGWVRTFDAADGAPLAELQLAPAVTHGTPLGGIARAEHGVVVSMVTDHECSVAWLSLEPELVLEEVVPISLRDVDPDEALIPGPPLARGGHVVVPIYYCVKGYTKWVVAVFHDASRALTAVRTPVGLSDSDCCALSEDGTLAWAVGEGIASATIFAGTPKTRTKSARTTKKATAKKKAPARSVSISLGEPMGAMAGGDPGRRGCFEGGLGKAPTIRWARAEYTSSSGEFGGSVVVGEGLAVGADSGSVTALDARTGKTRWSTPISSSRSWATGGISIAHGTVFIATSQGLLAFDGTTGEKLWRARVPGAAGAPLVFDDVCVIGGKEGLHARSLAKKGRKAWSFGVKDRVRTTPAYRDGLLYFYADAMLIALDVQQQAVRWSIPAVEPLGGGPVVTDEVVLHMPNWGVLAAADRTTGKTRWRTELSLTIDRPFAVSDETVVVRDGEGRLRAFDLATGQKRWTSKAGRKGPYGIGCGGPIIVGDTVVSVTVEETVTPANHLTGLALRSGRVRWNFDNTKVWRKMSAEQKRTGSGFFGAWSWYCTPYFADGMLYAQTDAGIVALGTSRPAG